jgi:hypothetical protein
MGRPVPIALLAIYSAVVGGLSLVLGVTEALDGQTPAIGRTILGVVGLLGGGLL